VLPPDDPGPQQQVYEAESSQEYFVRKEDGKVMEEVREALTAPVQYSCGQFR
jgi:hypothetical protein